MPPVSLLATLVATLAGFVLGAIWFGPMFGPAWMAESGRSAASLQAVNPTRTYGITFVLGALAAYVFGMLVGPHPDRNVAVESGALIGLCLVASALATSYLFEGKSLRLILISGGYHAVRFTLIGLVFGILG